MKPSERSITRHVTLSLLLVSVLVFTVTELALLERSHHALRTALDADLRTRADALDAIIDVEEDGEIEFDFSDQVMPDYSGPSPKGFFLLLRDGTDHEIGRSRSLDGEALELPREVRERSFQEPTFWNARVGERSIRFLAVYERLRMTEPDEDDEEIASAEPGTIAATEAEAPGDAVGEDDTEDEDEDEDEDGEDPEEAEGEDEDEEDDEDGEGSPELREEPDETVYSDIRCLFVVGVDTRDSDTQFRAILGRTSLALGIGLVLLLLTGRWVVRRSLRCLDEFKAEVQTISPGNLSPVPVPLEAELATVARTLNQVVLQLREAFDRERRFTADVAHELRTPLAEIRSLAEVALSYPDDLDAETLQSFRDVHDAGLHLQHIVEKLLILSRFDADQLGSARERFALEPALAPTWERYRPRAEARGLRLERRIPAGCTAFTDEHMLRTLFENVLSNAVEYAEPGSLVELEARREGDRIRLSLANRVADLERADLEHLFDRFWRKDAARTVDASHSGLGLAVVQSLASHLDIELGVDLDRDGVFRLDLVILS